MKTCSNSVKATGLVKLVISSYANEVALRLLSRVKSCMHAVIHRLHLRAGAVLLLSELHEFCDSKIAPHRLILSSFEVVYDETHAEQK